MKTCFSTHTRLLASLTASFLTAHLASANTALWIGNPGVSLSTNWSANANWNNIGTGGAGALLNDVKFGGTGSAGDAATITSVVDTDQHPLSLAYTNGPGQFHVTLIPAGITLSNDTALTVGGITLNSYTTVAAMVGGGTFIQKGNITIGNNGSTSADVGTLLDLSGLSNFVYNLSTGTITLSSGNRSAGEFRLAAISNHITAATFNANTASSSSSASGSLTLGPGTNVLNLGTFNVAHQRNNCPVQFAGTDGGLRLRGTGGTDADRTTMTLGNRSASGSGGTSTGTLSFEGHPVDLKFGTLTVGQSSNAGATGNNNGNGIINFDTGTIDATTLNLAVTTGNSFSIANGTITVGTNAAIGANGTLIVGASGLTMVNQGTGTGASSGTLNVNGGVVQVSGNIKKANTSGTATVNIAGGTVRLVGSTNSIGTAAIPIDALNLTDSTLTLPVIGGGAGVVVNALTINGSADTINISSVPGTSSFPTQYPLIAYTSLGGAYDFVLGSLPGTYQGYLSNNAGALTVDLVITNSLIKTDTWRGNVNGNWDTTTLNWSYLGGPVSFQSGDLVTFDDTLTGTPNVNLTTALVPGAVSANNSVANYVFSGTGKLTGNASLAKSGSGSLRLTESGGDDFTGGIVVNGGTLILDNTNSAIGGGLIVNSGIAQIGNNNGNGAVPSGPITVNGALVLNRTNTVTIATAISGTGTLTQNGSGTVALSAANSYSGSTTVANGTLALAGAGSISNSAAVSVANATLDVSALSQPTGLGALSVANAGVTVTVNASGAANIAATSLSMSGANNRINVAALPPIGSYPVTFPIIQAASAASGAFNFVAGTLPAATPAYTATVTQSADQTTVLLTVTTGPIATRPVVFWTGADVPNLNTNWSDRLNWNLPGAPTPGENVVFNNTGAQSASTLSTPGGGASAFTFDNVNNIVDADFTIAGLTLTNIADSYHNTFIKSGKTLALTNALTVGTLDAGGTVQHQYVTVAGSQATLSVNNPALNLQVWIGSSNAAGSQASLDLSALDTFNASVSRLTVGASAVNNAVNRPSGVVYLARTNAINAGFQTTTIENGTTTGNAAIDVADCNGNAGSQSFLWLGQVNTISADTIAIGRQKASGHLRFNSIYANVAPYPSVLLQGSTSSQVSVLDVGDGVGNTGTTTLSADADLTGGSVTANVDTMNVGRASSGTGGGTTTGLLAFDAGTIAVNTLNIGLQPSAGSKVGIGTVGVGSNTVIGAAATLIVRGNLSLGTTPLDTASSTTSGTLNVTNGAVFARTILAGTNSISGINIYGGRLVVTNTVATPETPLGNLSLLPPGTPDNDRTTLRLFASTAPAVSVNTLDLDGQANTTNVINIASAQPTVGVELPLIKYTTLNVIGGTFNLGLGTLPSGYTGYLTNDTTINAIALVLTTAPHVQPVMTSTSVQSGTNLVTSGTGGYPFGPYYVLSSTNVALPVSAWDPIATNNFDANGAFTFTNVISATQPQRFFLIQVP